MSAIVVEVTLEFKDYMRLYYPIIYKSRFLRIFIFTSAVAAIVIALLSSSGVGISFAIAIFFCLIYILNHTYKTARKTFRSNSTNREIVKYYFSQSQIVMETSKSCQTTNWEEIQKAEETKNTFLFYNSGTTFYLVPKRYFTNDQLMQLRFMLLSIPGLKVMLKNTNSPQLFQI